MSSMIADLCDLDELKTHERREGMYGSIYWWVVKLGMAAALGVGGYLLEATGFDVNLGAAQSEQTFKEMRIYDVVAPMVTSAIAMILVGSFGLTKERVAEVRVELEKRHEAMAQN